MLFCQFFIIKLKKLQIFCSWLWCCFLCDPFLLSCCRTYWETKLFGDRFTDLKIFFYSISCEIWRFRLFLIFFGAWRSYENSHTTFTTFLGWSLSTTKFWSFANALTLRFFLFVLAWARRFFLITRLGLVIRNMLFSSVCIVKLIFLLEWEALPFLDNFRNQLRFSHSWKLMTILIVLLTRKLSVQFGQLFFL